MSNIPQKQYIYFDPQRIGSRIAGIIILLLIIICIKTLFTYNFDSIYEFFFLIAILLFFFFLLKVSIDCQFPTYINAQGVFFKKNLIRKKILWENMDSIKIYPTTFDGKDVFKLIFYGRLSGLSDCCDCTIKKGDTYKALFEVIDEYAPVYDIKIILIKTNRNKPIVMRNMPKELDFP